MLILVFNDDIMYDIACRLIDYIIYISGVWSIVSLKDHFRCLLDMLVTELLISVLM